MFLPRKTYKFFETIFRYKHCIPSGWHALGTFLLLFLCCVTADLCCLICFPRCFPLSHGTKKKMQSKTFFQNFEDKSNTLKSVACPRIMQLRDFLTGPWKKLACFLLPFYFFSLFDLLLHGFFNNFSYLSFRPYI